MESSAVRGPSAHVGRLAPPYPGFTGFHLFMERFRVKH